MREPIVTPAKQRSDQLKITLGEHYADVETMASQYNMKIATFCAYCVKYFVESHEGRSLPPLTGIRQRSLDV